MYQGAHASAAGSKNPKGKKKRGRKRKKKNPSAVTWILIAGASAAAVGGGIAYAVHRKRKKAAGLLPPVNGGGAKPSGGGRPSGGGGGAKTNAPEFPYTSSEAQGLEDAWSVTAVAEAMPASGGPITKSLDAITDAAFYEIYKIRSIPGKSSRGTGWQPYIDSWMRIRGKVKNQVDAYNAAAVA